MNLVPTPDEFDDYIAEYVLATAKRIEGTLSKLVPIGGPITPVITADMIAHMAIRGEDVLALLKRTLSERGHAYGENVIFALGEDGVAMMLMTKIMRSFWSLNEGKGVADRRDTYLDIGGYAVLALAMEGYRQARQASLYDPTEEDDNGDF